MNDSPEVSVVMSVYNGADHLSETIGSVLAQEEVSFEFVIVDDGSTDESPSILKESARLDGRVKLIHQENQGLTKALIKGCAAARGKYVARQDVGDVSHPQRLRIQKEALDIDSELAFVSCWTEFCGPKWEHLYFVKGNGLAKLPIQTLVAPDEVTLIEGPYHHGSAMFRKESYVEAGGYRGEFYYAQDRDLWLRLAELGFFQVIEKTLYRGRVSPGSISTTNKVAQETLVNLALAARAQRRRGLTEEEVLAAANKVRPSNQKRAALQSKSRALYFIGECLRRNGDHRSVQYFRESIREDPFLLKSWLRIAQCFLKTEGTADNQKRNSV